MADEQQTPVPTFQDKLKMDAKDLWNSHKVFFVVFGILILVVKFREILIDLIVSSSKKTLEDATKQDTQLAAEETKDKADADKLVEQAKEEPLKEKPVDVDWYKKK